MLILMGMEEILLSLFYCEYNVHEKRLAEKAPIFCLLYIQHFLLVREDSFKLSTASVPKSWYTYVS